MTFIDPKLKRARFRTAFYDIKQTIPGWGQRRKREPRHCRFLR